jgi:PAS domain-containing protein
VARADASGNVVELPGASDDESRRSSVLVVGATASLVVVVSLMLLATGNLALAQLSGLAGLFDGLGNPSLFIAIAAGIIVLQMAFIAGLALSRSRRRRTELSFKENEEAMALAASSANIGLWSWDIGYDKVRATPHCKVILGLTGKEPCNLRTFLNCVHPDDRTMLREAIEKGIESRQKFDVEHRIVWPNGELRWIAASISLKLPASDTSSFGPLPSAIRV